MNFRIFYNQDMGGGGSPASSGSQGGGSAAPASPSAGSSAPSAAQNFASQLRQVVSQPSQESQPASDGKKTGADATAPEGDTETLPTDDQGTTDDGDGDSTPPEGKGPEDGWSPEELKALKAHGLDTMSFSPEAKKLYESNRELRAQFDKVSASNANAIQESEGFRQAVYAAANGDPKVLQDMYGIDLKLNQRTPDTILQDMQKQADGYRSLLQAQIDQAEQAGDVAGAQAILRAGNAILGQIDAEAKVILDEKKWQEREAGILQKAGKVPDKQNAFATLKGKAETHLTALTQEDPDAPKWFKEIEDSTKPGGALRALGIDLPRAYGTNLHTAREMNKIGKALATLKNMPQILNDNRKKWEAEYERKKSFGGTNGKTGGSRGSASGDNQTIARLQSTFSTMARGR